MKTKNQKIVQYRQQYYQTHKRQIVKQKKQWYQANQKRILFEKKQYYQTHKEAVSKYSKQWYQENSTKVKRRVHQRKFINPENYIFIRAKAGAKKRKIPFLITIKDIHIPKFCPVLGIKLQFRKGRHDNTPSLDRINNSKGYVPNNVEVISFRANRLKNDASVKEIEKLYKHYCK